MARRRFRRAWGTVTATTMLLTTLAAGTAGAATVGDDFEPGSPTVFGGTGATRDCTRAQGGSCSVKLDPPCCSTYVPATSPVNLALQGATTVSFYLYGESTGGNVDSDVHIVLDNGHRVLLHPTAGVNNSVSLLSANGQHNVFSSWSAGVWTLMTLRFDPATSRVTATVNGRSFTVSYPAATRIDRIEWYGVRWGSGTPIRYDTLRVENTPPVNTGPTTTLVAPADGTTLNHGSEQRFTVKATDAEGDAYTSVVTIRKAYGGAFVRALPIPALTASGTETSVVADPPLPPGEYTWSARSTDARGVTGPESALNAIEVGHLAYLDGRYVALGDSFSSGEGVEPFEDGTGSYGYDRCHRSYRSYSRLITGDANVPRNVDYWACSGAVTKNVIDGERFRKMDLYKDQEPQYSHLGDDVTLVTMTIGGNDAGFAHALITCVQAFDCHGEGGMEDYVGKRMNVLAGNGLPSYAYPLTAEQAAEHADLSGIVPLRDMYVRLRQLAPNAEVLIMGYPKFFSLQEGVDLFGRRFGGGCEGIQMAEQRWMNDKVNQINGIIKATLPPGFRYVDVENAFARHHLCDGSPEWMWNIDWQCCDPERPASPYSFHPNVDGQEAFAEAVRGVLATTPAGQTTHLVGPNQTVRREVPVIPNQPAVRAGVRWPGSDIELSLVSPSGRRITRATVAPDVTRHTGPTYDMVEVTNPEPGQWTVELFGADVPASGEEARLDVIVDPPVNQRPVAAASASLTRNTVTLDGGASTDPDGSIARYVWDFGDGWTESTTSPTVTNTYAKPGTYHVTLTVYDDNGASAFTSLQVVVVPYEFGGFASPINAAPTLNRVNAGRTIPVKWRLTDAGTPVSATSSFVAVTSVEVPCNAEAPVDVVEETTDSTAGLKYTGDGWWSYTWATSKAWAGTCRRMTLRLDDGSAHSALFDFR